MLPDLNVAQPSFHMWERAYTLCRGWVQYSPAKKLLGDEDSII